MQKQLLCPAVLAFFTASLSWAQATVNESLETSSIYVDVKTGSDNNSGSQSSPFKTIGKAIAIAQSNNASKIGTKVIINPGTYREVLTIQAGRNQSSMPMTFQAAQNGTVTISGAVQYTSWATYAPNNKIYTATWPNQWGLCALDTGPERPLEQDIVRRQEMVLVNGTLMTQVMSLSQMIFPGSFYVDETKALVYVWPPSGTNMSTADVEVPTNPQILTVNGAGATVNGIVFRGLTFAYANPCRTDGAVSISGAVTNILFDTDTFMWNNAQGLSMSGISNVTVLNSTSKHNGSAGFSTFQLKNILWQGSTASFNNWRGAQGVYYTWNSGGFHLFSNHNETWSGVNTTDNQSRGIHWDTDNQNISVTSVFDSGNVVGALNEKNEGPMTVTSSKFCNNSLWSGGWGFVFRNSENTTITNSTFYNNNATQVLITGVAGGIPITNWETGQNYNLITQNLTFTGNTVEGIGTSQLVFKDGFLGGTDWTTFQSTLKSSGNTWWSATNTTAFSVPTPKSGTLDTFAQWQSATGQDSTSKFVAPTTSPATACATTADGPDYWLLVDNGLVTTDLTGHAVFNLTTSSLGGLSGNVTFTLDGMSAIPGAIGTFSAGTIGVNGTSVLTFTAGTTTPAGTYTFTLLGNSGNVTRTAVLSVTVPTQTVRLSTLLLAFANQATGTTSPAQTVKFTNLGKTAINMSSMTISAGFAQTNTCGSSLAAGATCNINVTFTPHYVKAYTGKLTITDSAAGSPQIVTLTGAGI